MFCRQSQISFQSDGWLSCLRFDLQRALFNGGGFVGFEVGKRFSWSFCLRPVCRAVLNDDDGAGGMSKAMKWTRRPCSWPSRVSCASARKLFFSSAGRGWGSERGRGLAGRAITSTLWKKNGILILGRG